MAQPAPVDKSKILMKAIGPTKVPPFLLVYTWPEWNLLLPDFLCSQPIQTSELTEDSHNVQFNLPKVPHLKEKKKCPFYFTPWNLFSSSFLPLQSCGSHYLKSFLRAKCFHGVSHNIHPIQGRRICTDDSHQSNVSKAHSNTIGFISSASKLRKKKKGKRKKTSRWWAVTSHFTGILDLIRSSSALSILILQLDLRGNATMKSGVRVSVTDLLNKLTRVQLSQNNNPQKM